MGKFLIVLGSIIAVLSGGCSLLAVAESGLDDLFIGYVVIFWWCAFCLRHYSFVGRYRRTKTQGQTRSLQLPKPLTPRKNPTAKAAG